MAGSLPTVQRRRAEARGAALAVFALTVALTGTVAAQTGSSPRADAAPAPPAAGLDSGTDHPDNDAAFEGRVAAYLLSPEAGVAGLIFDDGRQVSVPPHLGPRLAALIQPGQQARIGARRDDARGPGSVRSILSIASGQALADGSPDAPRAAAGDGLRPVQASGTIRLRLHGPRGETNGLLLDTGTQVFFPPHVAHESGDWLQPGHTIDVEGYGTSSTFGTVVQATRIGGPGGLSVTVYRSADDAGRKRVDAKALRRGP